MSYINVEILKSFNLSLVDLGVLQLIKQNRTENMSMSLQYLLEDTTDLVRYEEEKLVEYINPKKKSDSVYKCVRITKKGSDILDSIATPEITLGDAQMLDYLINMYLAHEDKERVVGNKKKVAMYIAIMRGKLNLTLHQFFYLCELFLSEQKFTKKLENIFFDSNKNRYGDFKNNMEDSPLYQFYDSRKLEVEQYWQQKIKE